MTTTATRPPAVLHALRVCGFAPVDRLAAFVGGTAVQVTAFLEDHARDGLVRFRDGRMPGWLLTPRGRELHMDRLRQELASGGWKADVEAADERFLQLNRELKQICTNWQLRPVPGADLVVNDHTDPAYDAQVIESLSALHQRSHAMLDQLTAALDRFGAYRPRLEAALARLRDGDQSAFAKPLSASYHCVWMELHEDLLTTLCRERGEADGF